MVSRIRFNICKNVRIYIFKKLTTENIAVISQTFAINFKGCFDGLCIHVVLTGCRNSFRRVSTGFVWNFDFLIIFYFPLFYDSKFCEIFTGPASNYYYNKTNINISIYNYNNSGINNK